MTDLDQPIIAWENLLQGATTNVVAGTISVDTPISCLYDGDLLRPCYFTPNGAGQVIIEIIPTSPISCAILGSTRNDAAGFIAGATQVVFEAESICGFGTYAYGSVPFGAYRFGGNYTETITHDLTGAPASRLLRFMPTCTTLRLIFSGVVGALVLPQLWVGNPLAMPWLNLNYDPYQEVVGTAAFEAESGREYSRLRYRRIELDPSWDMIERADWPLIDDFREGALELRKPFWFAWMPNTEPTKVFLVKHVAQTAPFPIKSAKHRSFALKLKEVV
ncbi:MAG: hypothetical protein C0406_00635 [Sideroxydans sp.]|nr:hypothetical protein [Sideroxydans sp.]